MNYIISNDKDGQMDTTHTLEKAFTIAKKYSENETDTLFYIALETEQEGDLDVASFLNGDQLFGKVL